MELMLAGFEPWSVLVGVVGGAIGVILAAAGFVGIGKWAGHEKTERDADGGGYGLPGGSGDDTSPPRKY